MKKIRSEKAEYEENYKFWTQKGDELTVMGDFLGRKPSAELFKARSGEKILDAGCGAGFMSRIYARMGAKVTGLDRAKGMIQEAKKEEQQTKLGIKFMQGDIINLPFNDQEFDAVSCVAVLIHDSPEECQNFFNESYRVLKPGGRILISVTHPYVYNPQSPCTNNKTSWVQQKKLENKTMDQSQRFEETYRNAQGEEFISTVWYHPEKFLLDSLKKSGFSIIHTQSTYVTRDVLNKCNQTGEVGYPAFYQILAQK